ncbi:MAG: substrate-binding domain-containing protein [Pyrinomonadaceae bacterium]|nr:substrate-binding domain-containing protein [Pyrinomonadaceae bacterium]
MNKRLFLAVTLVFSALFLVSCEGPASSSTANATNSAGSTGKKIKIGFAMATVREERWQRDRDAFDAHCKKIDVECVITVADNSSSRQANDVDNLLTQGIDVLVIAPQEATEAAAMVEKAKAQGVPVISYDRLINSDKIDLYISHQVPVIGRKIAEFALQNVPKGNYVMVYGSGSDNNAHIMKREMLAVLQPAIDRGDIKIVADQMIPDWKNDLALNFAENSLTKENDNVQAFVVSNDGMAGGVIQALDRRGLTGKVLVTGQDAGLEALQNIAVGKQTMTVYKPIIPLASQAVDAAVKLAKKEALTTTPFKNDAINKEIPAILLEVTVVDKNNLMDTVIKDGYAKFEDVYKNVPESDRPKR